MQVFKNKKLNYAFKITYKSLTLALIFIAMIVDFTFYLPKIHNTGWIINWNGKLSVFGYNNTMMFTLNYLTSFYLLPNLFVAIYLIYSIFFHSYEAKTAMSSFPYVVFLCLIEFINFISFFAFVVPFCEDYKSMNWTSIIIFYILVPVLLTCYSLFLMENKSFYFIKEFLLKYSIWMLIVFIVILAIYFVFWHLIIAYNTSTENIINLNTSNYKDINNNGIYKFDDNSSFVYLVNKTKRWDNDGAISSNLLIQFTNHHSSIIKGCPKSVGIVIYIAFATASSFGISAFYCWINQNVVKSQKYIIDQKHNHGKLVYDIRPNKANIKKEINY